MKASETHQENFLFKLKMNFEKPQQNNRMKNIKSLIEPLQIRKITQFKKSCVKSYFEKSMCGVEVQRKVEA